MYGPPPCRIYPTFGAFSQAIFETFDHSRFNLVRCNGERSKHASKFGPSAGRLLVAALLGICRLRLSAIGTNSQIGGRIINAH